MLTLFVLLLHLCIFWWYSGWKRGITCPMFCHFKNLLVVFFFVHPWHSASSFPELVTCTLTQNETTSRLINDWRMMTWSTGFDMTFPRLLTWCWTYHDLVLNLPWNYSVPDPSFGWKLVQWNKRTRLSSTFLLPKPPSSLDGRCLPPLGLFSRLLSGWKPSALRRNHKWNTHSRRPPQKRKKERKVRINVEKEKKEKKDSNKERVLSFSWRSFRCIHGRRVILF